MIFYQILACRGDHLVESKKSWSKVIKLMSKASPEYLQAVMNRNHMIAVFAAFYHHLSCHFWAYYPCLTAQLRPAAFLSGAAAYYCHLAEQTRGRTRKDSELLQIKFSLEFVSRLLSPLSILS